MFSERFWAFQVYDVSCAFIKKTKSDWLNRVGKRKKVPRETQNHFKNKTKNSKLYSRRDHKIILKKDLLYLDERKLNVTKMGGEVEMLRERISFLEEENDNLMIEKEIALTKMEQVIFKGSVLSVFYLQNYEIRIFTIIRW